MSDVKLRRSSANIESFQVSALEYAACTEMHEILKTLFCILVLEHVKSLFLTQADVKNHRGRPCNLYSRITLLYLIHSPIKTINVA